MRGELHRQLLARHDRVAHDVGERDLRGGNQVQRLGITLLAALSDREQVLLELGQLTGAAQGRGVDDVGRVALGVAVLGGLYVEHELGERAVQPCDAAAHEAEA